MSDNTDILFFVNLLIFIFAKMVGLLRTPLLNCVVDLMCPLCCVENKEILNPIVTSNDMLRSSLQCIRRK